MTPAKDPTRSAMRNTLEGEDSHIDLQTLLAIIRRGKWIILGGLFAGFLIGIGYVVLVPPVYQASALLQVEQQGGARAPALGMASLLLPGILQSASSTDAEILIMTSRAVLMPVIRKLHLDLVVRGAPRSAVQVKEFVIPDQWNGKSLRLVRGPGDGYTLYGPEGQKILTGYPGQLASGARGSVRLELTKLALSAHQRVTLVRESIQQVFHALQSRIHAAQKGQDTGIVRLTFEGHDARNASRILNSVIAQYRAENINEFSAQALQTLAFIHKQLPGLKNRVDRAASRLAAYQSAHNTINLDEQTKALLAELGILEGQLTELELARARYAEQYTRRFPVISALRNEEHEIQMRIARLHQKLEALPIQAPTYVRLTENALIYGKLYTSLLSTEQDLRIREAGTIGDVRIVEPAIPPLAPIAPRKAVDLFISAVIGLALGIFAAFLRHSLTPNLRDPDILEATFRLPVFAVIPHSRRQQALDRRPWGRHPSHTRLLIEDDPHDITVEALRSMRTSTEYALDGATHRAIVLGGPAPGVGKSFISANLACVYADSGKRVLLIDADLRRGHLHRYFDQARSPGLADVLSGRIPWRESVQKDKVDLIATGDTPPRPTELLMRSELANLLHEAVAVYDLVLIDVPPVLAVSDALIIGRHADLNILILKAECHSLEEVRTTLRRHEQSGVPVNGFVFNDLRPNTARYGYRYQYRYGRKHEA